MNYDGIAKHRTRVGERAFIGCNVNLIAPVVIAPDSFVAAGTTVTKDVPEHALAVGRPEQRHVAGWVSRRLEAAKRRSTGKPAKKPRKS